MGDPGITLRPKARADLDGIWDYTVETWGYEQAERYLRDLNRAFELLVEKPELGRIYDEVYPGLRVYPFWTASDFLLCFRRRNRRRARSA